MFYNKEESMDNIIFLDIDGVLNNNDSKFSVENIITLRQLISFTNSKIVIISSRQGNGREYIRNKIRDEFKKLKIYNIDFIDPNFEGSLGNIKLPSRILGIVDYLKRHKTSNYIILDDEYSNDYKLMCLNYYKTSTFNGLTYSDLYKIKLKPVNLNNFKHVNYKYRKLGSYELATNNLIKTLKKGLNK